MSTSLPNFFGRCGGVNTNTSVWCDHLLLMIFASLKKFPSQDRFITEYFTNRSLKNLNTIQMKLNHSSSSCRVIGLLNGSSDSSILVALFMKTFYQNGTSLKTLALVYSFVSLALVVVGNIFFIPPR